MGYIGTTIKVHSFIPSRSGGFTVDTKILHELSMLYDHNSQALGYLGSCRISSFHRSILITRASHVIPPAILTIRQDH